MSIASKAITTIGEEVGQKIPGSFFSSAYRQVEKITGKSVLGNKIAKDEIGPSLRALYTSGVTDAKVAARYYSEGVPLEGVCIMCIKQDRCFLCIRFNQSDIVMMISGYRFKRGFYTLSAD